MNRSMLVFALALASCGGKNPGAYQTVEANAGADAAALNAEADALWEQRADEAKLQAALAKYEEAAKADPANRHALGHLVRGWYFWGDGYTNDDAVKIERWEKAIEWGKSCLAVNSKFKAQIEGGAKEKDAVSVAVKDDVPCLYWMSSALGKWGKAQGLAKTLKHLPTVKAYMTKVDELDPTYFHYGPSRYWGAYYSIIPSFAGQDFDKSAEYFETSINGAPNYLGTRMLRAENWAVGVQDPVQFDKDIKFVLGFDLDTEPGLRAENEKEQAKAKALLEKREELFDKKVLAEIGKPPSEGGE